MAGLFKSCGRGVRRVGRVIDLMSTPSIVSTEEWEAARQQLLVNESELARCLV
jgi:hypothetical protein